MDGSIGEQKSNNPNEVVYSSSDILTDSVAGRRDKSFGILKKSKQEPQKPLTRTRRVAGLKLFVKQHKKLFVICSVATIAVLVVGAFLLWFFVWRQPAVEVDLDSDDSGMTQPSPEIPENEGSLISNELNSLIAADTGEAYAEASNLFEDTLSKYSDSSLERTVIVLDYASALIYADRFLEAQEALSRLDIDAYKKPESLTETQYLHQRLEYYALMRDALLAQGLGGEAKSYDQKVIELTNEEDKLAGDRQDVEK